MPLPEETCLAAAREILRRCDLLAACSETPGSITRRFLTPPMCDVHRHVGGWMREAGMTVHVDAVGNIVGRREGTAPGAPAIIVGSHLDTVPNAGKYDGVLGVLAGIAAVQHLQKARPAHSIEVIGFSEEEGVRFRTPFLGSRAVAGSFDPSLLALRDEEGHRMSDAIASFGLDPTAIASSAYDESRAKAYLELHIEQGPQLERAGQALGVVGAIVGQSKLELRFEGRAGHAGTTPMEGRCDALAGAAELVLAVEQLAGLAQDVVATVGRLIVEPGATNVIPSRVALSLDVRHAEDDVRRMAVAMAMQMGGDIARRRGLGFTLVSRADQRAVPCDPGLRALLTDACKSCGETPLDLASGAGHDAMIMEAICPVAMLFVRCRGGLSHHPDEHVSESDVASAFRVLVEALEQLAKGV